MKNQMSKNRMPLMLLSGLMIAGPVLAAEPGEHAQAQAAMLLQPESTVALRVHHQDALGTANAKHSSVQSQAAALLKGAPVTSSSRASLAAALRGSRAGTEDAHVQAQQLLTGGSLYR